MGRIIAITNQKGGVGKTTSCCNIGDGLHRLSKKVLMIDIDPEAHLTYSLGIPAHKLDVTVNDLLENKYAPEDIMIDRKGMHIIPSSMELSGAEIELSKEPGGEFMLKEAIGDFLDNYEYTLIDCPPSLGYLTLNALTTANEIFVPLQTEYLALRGLRRLTETIDIVKNRLNNNNLEITGVIATRFHQRKNLHKEVVENIKGHFGEKVFKTLIRENISLAEAPSGGKTIFEYEPNSHGAEDYRKLCKEIIRRG